MFQIGDKILYPMYGVGIIKAVEEKEILGKRKLYYTLSIPQIKMNVMVPMDKAAELGIRQLVTTEVIENALRKFHLGDTDPNIYENQRYCREINKRKIRGGNIYEETEIIRDLTRKGQRGKLGTEDLTMLNNARQIFVSELMQVKDLPQEQAIQLLDEVINDNEPLSEVN